MRQNDEKANKKDGGADAGEAGAHLEESPGSSHFSEALAHSRPAADVPRLGSWCVRPQKSAVRSRYREGDWLENYGHVSRYFTGLPKSLALN